MAAGSSKCWRTGFELAGEGRGKPDITKLLEDFVVQQRTHADFREADEETVLDVLDALGGGCHPTANVLPHAESRAGIPVEETADDMKRADLIG